MSLILGLDNFGEAITERLDFVDKSLFIKEIFDNAHIQASIIIRPRRFGKTFNMSMLQHFLAAEVNGLKTAGMFDNLKIAKAGQDYMQHQGQYPVIATTFKGVKVSNFESAYQQLSFLITQAYKEHIYLRTSDKLTSYEQDHFNQILAGNIPLDVLKNALLQLSEYLHRYHGVKPWLLIDEYDTPIQAAYFYDFYKPMIEVMRGVFGGLLKGNPNIHRAVITGIVRVAKEDLFSGANNVITFSVLNSKYAEYFGFTQAEVDDILKKNDLQNCSAEIKKWYNGYRIGDQQIYNPWSIASCIDQKGEIKPYWINTSDNLLVKRQMARADVLDKQKFESLLAGEPIVARINEAMVFADLNRDGESLWALLLLSGYVTALDSKNVGAKTECTLIPPNIEIASLYPDIIVSWFVEALGERNYHYLLQSLTQGDLEVFLKLLEKFLLESASYFDVKGTEPEKFYHGFVMGLIVGLADTYRIHSNKESGYGRYDVMLIPKDPKQLGLVLEFKVADEEKDLQVTAEQALAQIIARGYATELQQQGIQNILQIGLAFHGKSVSLVAQ